MDREHSAQLRRQVVSEVQAGVPAVMVERRLALMVVGAEAIGHRRQPEALAQLAKARELCRSQQVGDGSVVRYACPAHGEPAASRGARADESLETEAVTV